jgi:hypothetical protein
MAKRASDPAELVESCANCGRETSHAVTVELRTESSGGANALFSREPYRIAECRACGEAAVERMSDA